MSAFPAYWYLASVSSVSALSMNTSTAICVELLGNVELHSVLLRHVGLVLDEDDVLVLSVVVVSVPLLHVELLELVPGTHLVSLGSLKGGEGSASGFSRKCVPQSQLS